MQPTRRTFLKSSLVVAGAALSGCGSDDLAGPGADAAQPPDVAPFDDIITLEDVPPDVAPDVEDVPDVEPDPCTNPFAGGELLGTLGFVGEGNPPLDEPFNEGLDGRLYHDLSAMTHDTLLTPIEHFYIRTRKPDTLDLAQPSSATINALVEQQRTLTIPDLEPLIEPQGTHLLECSGNGINSHFGMLSATEFSGVSVEKVLGLVDIKADATRVLIGGYDDHSQFSEKSTPGASWVFTLEQLKTAGAFLATHMGGEPLTPDHGQPVRLYVPGWYGCCSAKWLNEIRLVNDDEPATSQMKEFATRTHQSKQHALARDYIAATMDQAAMPIRVEKWRVDGALTYRVWGILWGGYQPATGVLIKFAKLGFFPPWAPVDVCPAATTNATWTLWSHQWTPEQPGDYEIALKLNDPEIPTRRLDLGYYNRVVRVEEI